MPLQAGTISQAAGTGFQMGRSPLSQNLQKLMQIGVQEGGANQRSMMAAGYEPEGGFKGWGKAGGSMDEIYSKIKDYTGAGHDVDITMGNTKLKLKGKTKLTDNEKHTLAVRASTDMMGQVNDAEYWAQMRRFNMEDPYAVDDQAAGGGGQGGGQVRGGGQTGQTGGQPQQGGAVQQGMGNISGILQGIKEKLGRAGKVSPVASMLGTKKQGKFTLPAQIKTTSQALAYLTEKVGLSEPEAREWIRRNATTR